MIQTPNPTRTIALDHMTRALEAAKQARDRGVNVREARQVLKEARSAFERGDYPSATERADYLLQTFGVGSEVPVPAPVAFASEKAPTATALGAAAGRLAEAKEAVRQAKAHGFNVQMAKAALRQAKRAFRSRDYGAAVQLASQAIQLSGSTGRVRP